METLRKLTPWPGCYLAPDTGAESGASGAETSDSTGVAGGGTSVATTDTGQAETPEEIEQRLRADHQRELDRYRNTVGQQTKEMADLKAALKRIEDEKKPELERLTEAAGRVPGLEQERDGWKERAEAAEAAIAAEVDARQKSLPKEMLDLLPEGSSLVQFEWLRKAQAAAEKLKPTGGTLPPGGGRNPGAGSAPSEPTKEQQQIAARHYAGRF